MHRKLCVERLGSVRSIYRPGLVSRSTRVEASPWREDPPTDKPPACRGPPVTITYLLAHASRPQRVSVGRRFPGFRGEGRRRPAKAGEPPRACRRPSPLRDGPPTAFSPGPDRVPVFISAGPRLGKISAKRACASSVSSVPWLPPALMPEAAGGGGWLGGVTRGVRGLLPPPPVGSGVSNGVARPSSSVLLLLTAHAARTLMGDALRAGRPCG